MPDQRITLTDIMLGIKKLSLINKLHYSHFAFFWGIIMEANEHGFKNPIELTTKQAMAAGGGTSRQGVWRKREALQVYRVNGEPLISVESGDKRLNTCAKYEINYKLLLNYKTCHHNDDRGVTKAMTPLSSVNRFSDDQPQKRNNINNVSLGNSKSITEDDKKHDIVLKAINKKYPAFMGPQGDIKAQKFNDLLEYDLQIILDSLDAACNAKKRVKLSGLLEYMLTVAQGKSSDKDQEREASKRRGEEIDRVEDEKVAKRKASIEAFNKQELENAGQ